jgi:hypothetical protein
MNGEMAASRELSPALTGRDSDPNDPPVMQQFGNELDQARCFIEDQTRRIRQHTDNLFGMQPTTEHAPQRGDGGVEAVRPMSEVVGTAIRMLHVATQELSHEMDRLEGHRLT